MEAIAEENHDNEEEIINGENGDDHTTPSESDEEKKSETKTRRKPTALIETISQAINEEIKRYAAKINAMHPEVPVQGILEIWNEMQNMPPTKTDESDKTCRHRFVKGKNANLHCKIRVKGDGDYCSKHKRGP